MEYEGYVRFPENAKEREKKSYEKLFSLVWVTWKI